MDNPIGGIIAVAAAYAIGSVPFGYLTARLVRGIDIRNAGSGNIGATNVARVLGARWGVLVLVFDALKGALPVLLLPMLVQGAESPMHIRVACGMATIVGHMLPCWLRFRGGKGVATALGVVLVIAPWGTLAAVGTFAVVFAAFRIVALSSIAAAVSFAGCQMWILGPNPFAETNWSRGLFSLLVPALIIYRHRSNIVRLVRGEEPRFRFGSAERELESSGTEKEGEPGGTADAHDGMR